MEEKKLRAKFYVRSVDQGSENDPEEVHLSAVYGKDDEDNKENNQFSEATPFGELTMLVSSPSAKGFFMVGEEYYLDISKASK